VADHWLVNGLLTLSGLVLIGMTLLMVYNIVARSLFDAPVDGVVTIVAEALMIAVVYLAFAAPVQISIRLLINRSPALARRVVDTVTWVISIVVFAVAAWASTTRAIDSFERGERTVGTSTFLLYPYRFLVAAGLLAAAIHVVVLGRRWVAGATETWEDDTPPGQASEREGLSR